MVGASMLASRAERSPCVTRCCQSLLASGLLCACALLCASLLCGASLRFSALLCASLRFSALSSASALQCASMRSLRLSAPLCASLRFYANTIDTTTRVLLLIHPTQLQRATSSEPCLAPAISHSGLLMVLRASQWGNPAQSDLRRTLHNCG